MVDFPWEDETAEPIADVTYLLAIKDTGVGAEPLEEALVDAAEVATAAQLTAGLAVKSDTGHTHVAANVTDFSEAVDDRVAVFLVAGPGITLTYNDGANTLTVTDGWTYVRLTSDETSTSATSAATALTFTPAASKRYEIFAHVLVQSVINTTGPRIAVGWPTGLVDSASAVTIIATSAGATLTPRFIASQETTQVAAVGVAVADTTYLDLVFGSLTTDGSPSGAFTLMIASEIGASAVKFMTGSFLKYREIP